MDGKHNHQSNIVSTNQVTTIVKKNTDEKNFRSSYYSKVGFVAVEEKSIEALLNPIDLDKIRMFIKTYPIPETHRLKIWKILLGILTGTELNGEYRANLRKLFCDNILNSLKFLGFLKSDTTESQKLVLMYIFENGNLCKTIESMLELPEAENYFYLSQVFVEVFSINLEDNYFLFKNFINLLNNYKLFFPQLTEEVYHMIAKEDKEFDIFLKEKQIGKTIQILYSRCFSGILENSFLIRIWDKIIGGYFRLVMPKIVFYVLITLKSQLCSVKDSDTIQKIVLARLPSDKIDKRIIEVI